MKPRFILVPFLLMLLPWSARALEPSERLNVLFIYSDDLRPELGCYGHPLVKAPNIDALARSGVKFDKAYCQYPLCNPSRASLLTGRQPHAIGVLDNRTWFGVKHPDAISLPKHFKDNGYVTLRSGKIFHGGIDDYEAWTEGGDRKTTPGVDRGLIPNSPSSAAPTEPGKSTVTESEEDTTAESNSAADASRPSGNATRSSTSGDNKRTARKSDSYIVIPGDGDDVGDGNVAGRAIHFLQQYKDKPFFLGVGFVKPHSPLEAPQRFFDLYDPASVPLPPDFAPRPTAPPGIPAIAVRKNTDLFVGRDASESEAREFIRAYWASLSWMDHNVGRVINELDRLGLRQKTIIVFVGDHGYHLGEKGRWSKAGSLFEVGARIPLIVVAPNAAGNGTACPRVVEAVDLYRTLVELTGLSVPAGVDGKSLVPLLNEPNAAWDRPAYTVWSEAKRKGFSVRTAKYRYAEWEGQSSENAETEALEGRADSKREAFLFDLEADPHELRNLVNEPNYAQTVAEHSELLSNYRAVHVR